MIRSVVFTDRDTEKYLYIMHKMDIYIEKINEQFFQRKCESMK